MKLPIELSKRLAKQWENGRVREQRLLSAGPWPIQLAIGIPSVDQFVNQTALIRDHIEQWRKIKIGKIIWTEKKYLESSEKVKLPEYWRIDTPSEWASASANAKVQQEFKTLETIVNSVDPIFHSLIVRKPSLIMAKPIDEVVQATYVALGLRQNFARGKPLRALSVANCDSKFFERNRNLVTQLLDVRFDGAVSESGLERFLNAADDKDHWLLIAPLDTQLLPFAQCRIRTTELAVTELPASHIIVVENEQCLHQLPQLANTIAILGAGLDLTWLQAPWLKTKIVAYWGDMDTWGFTMLAIARSAQPQLTAVLMDQDTFDKYAEKFAIMEPQIAEPQAPAKLTNEEQAFYRKLLNTDKGRLEQEFLPKNEVVKVLSKWHKAS